MTITKRDFPVVEERAQSLGCVVPDAIAVLPRNFAEATKREELIHESNAATVRVLLRNAGITETPIEPEGEGFPCAQENDFTWVGPILFFTAAQLANDPKIISVSLGVIANHLTDFFRGITGKKRVTFDVVVEQTKTKKCVGVHYDGDEMGFSALADIVKELVHDERENS